MHDDRPAPISRDLADPSPRRAPGRRGRMSLPPPVRRVARDAWRDELGSAGGRSIPAGTAVAFTYNRTAPAGVMATPPPPADSAAGLNPSRGTGTRPP